MYEFHCPHCSTPLRLRDHTLRGQTIQCPECREPVRIEQEGDQLVGYAAKKTPPASALPGLPRPPRSSAAWISAGVAVVLILGLTAFALTNRSRAVTSAPSDSAPVIAPLPAPESPAEPEAPSIPAPDGVEQRLARIYALLEPMLIEQETFPAGTVQMGETPAFSWIAPLAKTALPPAPADWSKPWNAPPNSDFVRRRFPDFDNPLIPSKGGDDGYPTTHFVGVTGIGPDASRLPKEDRRAGIFGEKRQTTVADVRDGLSNALLIAGIERQLGSWARPGAETMRSFSQEPYINGPDGFGTGQPDGMFVLMADGSVRFLAAATDPVIVRRMAAMADGLPLDPNVPGDPLDPPVPPSPVASVPPPEPANPTLPDLDTLFPGMPKMDINKQLTQQVVLFEQSTPTPLEDLLFDLQELAGVPFDLSQLPEEKRKLPVTLRLENVSLQQILDALTEKAGVSARLEAFQIVLTPR